MNNPLGIHCTFCTTDNPCPECHIQIVAEQEYSDSGAPAISSANTFGERHQQLTVTMAGFSGLIDVVQGVLTGWSIATGEIWHTGDIETTKTIARHCLTEAHNMVSAYGLEQ